MALDPNPVAGAAGHVVEHAEITALVTQHAADLANRYTKSEADGKYVPSNGNVGFFGVAPVARPAALTASDASLVDAVYGTEEAAVIANLRTRVEELEARLRSLGLLT